MFQQLLDTREVVFAESLVHDMDWRIHVFDMSMKVGYCEAAWFFTRREYQWGIEPELPRKLVFCNGFLREIPQRHPGHISENRTRGRLEWYRLGSFVHANLLGQQYVWKLSTESECPCHTTGMRVER